MTQRMLRSWLVPVLLLSLALGWWGWRFVDHYTAAKPEPPPVLRLALPCMMDNTAPKAHGAYVVVSPQVPGWCHVVTGEELPGRRAVLGLLKSWSSVEGQPAMVLMPDPEPTKGPRSDTSA